MHFLKKWFSKSYSTELTVTSDSGFHLRPVAQFVAKAKTFDLPIKATFKDKSVNAKAVNTLLSLNLDKGDSFTITVASKDAKEAQNTLTILTDTFDKIMTTDANPISIKRKDHSYVAPALKGDIVCDGIGIAPLYFKKTKETYEDSGLSFSEAVSSTLDELETLYLSKKSQSDAEIYLAQKELLFALSTHAQTLASFEDLITQESQALKGGKLEAKIADYQDILQRVKTHLGYGFSLSFPSSGFILVADDLLPSDIEALSHSKTQGVILKETSQASHTAILLRASGLPSLILNQVLSADSKVILDAKSGVLILNPSEDDLEQAVASKKQHDANKQQSYSKRHDLAFTKDKKHIAVLANISDLASATLAKNEGAEGIGLLRTEFLFGQVKPSFEVQKEAYLSIFSLFDDVTVRTLDVGGDKNLPYINIAQEENPFLGVRGIRLFKTHPEVLEEQLLAIFAASQGRSIKVMFPMVSTVSEFIEAKHSCQELARQHHIDISNILFGIMIEVPSVLFLIESFNEVVDFYSIGTNDLTQYLFATERTHALLKVDAHSPLIFSVLKSIVKQSNKPISICGELASDTKAIHKLIALGLDKLSVTSKTIAQTKETIRHA